MKKLFILILLIGIVGTAHYFYRKFTDSNNIEPAPASDKIFRPDTDSATFTFDEGSVTLSNGKNDEENSETILLDQRAYGDLNGDNKEDSVVLLSQSGGGSGVFIYAAAYVSGPVNYKGTNTFFLGDRISPQSVSISNGIATIKYLDREPDEALAAEPTVPVVKLFIYKNGEFVER